MPLLVLPAELPTPDVVVVVPEDGGRVVVVVDPRVPRAIADDAIARVRQIIHSPGDVRVRLSALVKGPPHAMG